MPMMNGVNTRDRVENRMNHDKIIRRNSIKLMPIFKSTNKLSMMHLINNLKVQIEYQNTGQCISTEKD